MPKTAKNEAQYSDPALRERLKKKILKGTKGGRSGQWSARKAQLLAAEYKGAGGRYTRPPSQAQESLQKWTEEEWATSDGGKAVQGTTTRRYLPKKAWEKLSPGQKAATNKKKTAASKTGKQFVANTKAAADARKKVTAKVAKKAARKAPNKAVGKSTKKAVRKSAKNPAGRESHS
jgi:hypothetical protein